MVTKVNKRRHKAFGVVIVGLFLGLLLAEAMLPARAQTVTEETTRKVKVVVRPEYPQLARDLKMQGIVRLQATVSADGKVLNVKERGGNPVLVDAAIKAVKKWKYEAGAKDTVEDVKLEFVL